MNYRVTWEIDIEADSPLEAAQEAREMQADPESTATIYTVQLMDSRSHELSASIEVDLADEATWSTGEEPPPKRENVP